MVLLCKRRSTCSPEGEYCFSLLLMQAIIIIIIIIITGKQINKCEKNKCEGEVYCSLCNHTAALLRIERDGQLMT